MSKYSSKNIYTGIYIVNYIHDLLMLKALLPTIIKLFSNMSVLHRLGNKSVLLPPPREYYVSWIGGKMKCNLCAVSIRTRSKNLLQIISLRINNGTTAALHCVIIATIWEDCSWSPALDTFNLII